MNNLIFLAKASEFQDPVGSGTAWADRWARFTGLGIQTFILGMLTVFAVLAILWGCLEVFRYVFYTIPEKKKAEANRAPQPAVEADAKVVESAPVADTDDGEIVAAIIAAITAMRDEEAAESGVAPGAFRVVSFRKRH